MSSGRSRTTWRLPWTSWRVRQTLRAAPCRWNSPLTDPRFSTPFSGYYWQVKDVSTGALTRSRSLWDEALVFPAASDSGAPQVAEITGPDGALLLALDRTIADPNGQSFEVVVARDHRTVEDAVASYVAELVPALALLGGVLLAAIFIQITVGLAPLQTLRAAVREVVAKRAARLQVAAPREVKPLAEEINHLLDAQDKALVRARQRAADLAHGLKTPLQVMFADIRVLRDKGETALADEIERSATAIRRHVDRELARARMAPGVGFKGACRVANAVTGVLAVVRRTPEGQRLKFEVEVRDDLVAPIDEGDLSEILGNLVENAARFARSTIRIRAEEQDDGTVLAIVDDGPGLTPDDARAVLSRGVTGNGSSTTGSGLGLAIVSDIVAAYGGSLRLTSAEPGLRATITLPRRSA